MGQGKIKFKDFLTVSEAEKFYKKELKGNLDIEKVYIRRFDGWHTVIVKRIM
jgi:hypothetical protein